MTVATPVPLVFGDYALEDRYRLDKGRVYMTGIQALVRLPMMQRQRDLAAGLNTGGFISGYRGSPLGMYDHALWTAKKYLKDNNIHFQPGINEDLAATAVWGTQQVNLFPGAKVDGVFSIWYGKGPGVDRSMDVLKHGNAAGSSPHGGVIVLAGDDHGAQSSTLPHQSEQVFSAAMIPVINPANVQEYLDFGLLGFALSRYSGCWIGFKAISETVEVGRLGVGRSRAHQDHHADRLPAAAGRARHPQSRSADGGGEAPAWTEDGGGQGVRARQRLRPHGDRSAAGAHRHHDHGQGLSRHAPGPGGSRHQRGAREGARHPPLQGRHDLAAGAGRRAPLRRRPAGSDRHRGEAVQPRGAARPPSLQHAGRPPAAGDRQGRRDRRHHPAERRRAHADRRGHGDRRPPDEAHGRIARAQAAAGPPRSQGEASGRAAGQGGAHAVLLLGLPAQHVDARPRGQPRHGRHRLPRHGDLDARAAHRADLPHGRRRRAVGRPGAVQRRQSHLPEPGRRHLLPLRPDGDPPGRGGRRQHHLQDPVQRRGRHDRRPAA